MRPYFEKIPDLGRALKKGEKNRGAEDERKTREAEGRIETEARKVRDAGFSESQINDRGSLSVWQRIEYLVDEGSFCPLHTLFNPLENLEGTTNVIDGLGKISGRWAVIIGFDNKVMAGAWLPGQSENILRVTDLAKRLHIPLVWLVNCSGAKLTEQEKFYAGRRGAGAPFFRNAELSQLGIPIPAAIYGTNPAGGGYQAGSPMVLFAHKNCSIAVGGAGIVTGMAPKGRFDQETAEELVEKVRSFTKKPPGTVATHFGETGFFKAVFETETEVLDALKSFMEDIPAWAPRYLRVALPAPPRYPVEEIYQILPSNPRQVYDFEQVLARLVDGSEQMEFRPDYGREVYTGLCKVDGFLTACIGNRQGYLGMGYPEYALYPGMGGRIYRQGLIKMSEFVTLCGRDRIPIIWFQDTTGLDVGEEAEKAELLGLGQTLIYSVQQTDIPMMLVVLRKGTGAAHYMMGGPTANDHNAFTLGTIATQITVMHGETAAVATYSRRLVKKKAAGEPLDPVIDKMNQMVDDIEEKSKPLFCAKKGFVDEIVPLSRIRDYMVAFAGAVYQNPESICPQHHMLLPRLIKW